MSNSLHFRRRLALARENPALAASQSMPPPAPRPPMMMMQQQQQRPVAMPQGPAALQQAIALQQQQQQQQQQTRPATARPVASRNPFQPQQQAAPPGLRKMPGTAAASAPRRDMPPPPGPPPMPFVFRKTAEGLIITDSASGEDLQLEADTWVLTAPRATPASSPTAPSSLELYAIDDETAEVRIYTLNLPAGGLKEAFAAHTLNVADTLDDEAAAATNYDDGEDGYGMGGM